MESASSGSCPGCKTPLTPGRAQGLCPRCLLARAALLTPGPGLDSPQSTLPDAAVVAAAFPQLDILGLVGRGGMGVVYRARQKSLDRIVALKLLAPGRDRDPRFAERFAREARALAALNHPHIVTIHDFGFAPVPDGAGTGGYYFLLMEYVDGVNLREAMSAGRFTPEQALAVVPPVCSALQYAHDRGIVHRDIKPENLLLDRDGRIKIADFGIARLLGDDSPAPGASGSEHAEPKVTTTSAAGTPQYMAPEQRAPDGRADHRADIYSLGVVLYELLTGELPGHRLDPPSSKVHIDVRLDEVVLRALESKPERRYPTADAFRSKIDTLADGSGGVPNVASGEVHGSRIWTTDAVIHTPEELASAEGQFCIWRFRGRMVLDDRQLLVDRDGLSTRTIPLRSMTDVSLSRYPIAMNPARLSVVRITYSEGSQQRQLYLAPMRGWFAMPRHWNDRVASGADRIRDAVTRATGRPPGVTSTSEIHRPASHPGILALFLASICLPALFLSALLLGRGVRPLAVALAGGAPVIVAIASAAATFALLGNPRKAGQIPVDPWTRVLGGGLMFGAVILAGWLLARGEIRRHIQREWEAARQSEVQSLHDRAVGDPSSLPPAAIPGGVKASITARRGLALASAAPLAAAGLWLLCRRRHAGAGLPPRAWMRWIGGACLVPAMPLTALGTWIAFQISQDTDWNPAPAEALTAIAVWVAAGTLAILGMSLLAFARPERSRAGWFGALAATFLATVFSGVVARFTLSGEFDASRPGPRGGAVENRQRQGP